MGAGFAVPVGAQAAPRFVLVVNAGYQNLARESDWTPVVVTITNNGDDFRGSLQVAGDIASTGCFGNGSCVWQSQTRFSFTGRNTGAAGAGTTHSQAVNLPHGSTRRFTDWVIAGPEIRASLLGEGGQQVAAAAAMGVAVTQTGDLLLGVVSDRSETLSELSALTTSAGRSVRVAHLSPSNLPASAIPLLSFDVLLFDGATTDQLSAGQRTALQDYVDDGGGLVLVAGTDARVLSGIPAALMPATQSGAATLADLPAMARLLGASKGPGPVEVARLTPAAGAHSLSDGGLPLVVSRQVGTGHVVLLGFDPDADPVASWSGRHSLMLEVLARASPTPIVAQANPFGSFGYSGNSITSALGTTPALELPSVPIVGLLLLVYVLAVGPGNYLLLRRRRRRELGWLTVPAIVLVFSSVAYAQGLQTKGGAVLANRVNVIRLEPGTSRGFEVSYTGIVAPHRGTYSVGLGPNSFASTMPDVGYTYPSVAQGSTVVIDGAPSSVELEGVTAYAIRAFTTEQYSSLAGGGFSVHLQPSGQRLSGTVTNLTGQALTDVATVGPGRASMIGKVAAGSRISIDLAGGSTAGVPVFKGGPDVASQLYPGGISTGSAADRDRLQRQAVLRTVFPPNPFGVTGNYLVGWIQDSGAVRVGDEDAKTASTTLFLLPLDDGAAPSAASVAAGAVPARAVDFSGKVNPSGYQGGFQSSGVSLDPGAAVTYEMDLPGASWQSVTIGVGTKLQTAACAAIGPVPVPGNTGVTTPNGTITTPPIPVSPVCAPLPALYAFNFRTYAWVGVTPATVGNAVQVDLDPRAGFVSPDGTVLVRLAAPPSAAAGINAWPVITAVAPGSAT